ncbi:MAG: hypothetical protein H0W34_12115 [Pyrinomonadaceae bacterium]|nr:hypothetical protein [Pyrinomonadaceae bacterium]
MAKVVQRSTYDAPSRAPVANPVSTLGVAPGPTAAQTEQSRKDAEARKADAVKGVDERNAAMQKQNEEFYAADAARKPTPTQRENDLAKVGALDIDDKEDDGSGPEMKLVMRREAIADDSSSTYKTRDVRK